MNNTETKENWGILQHDANGTWEIYTNYGDYGYNRTQIAVNIPTKELALKLCAAPEMLEALDKVLLFLANLHDVEYKHKDALCSIAHYAEFHHANVLAAIAKATKTGQGEALSTKE